MSFNCLSINRRDGSCIPHSSGQVNFAKIIQNNINAVSQLAFDKCNQNVDANQAHASSAIDRMSQSVYDTCHQIFDDQENLQFSEHHHHRPAPQRRKRIDSAQCTKYEKVLPQLAFEMDSLFGVLWVFDAIEKKCFLYNVIGSEIPRNLEYSSHLLAILQPELMLPKNKSDVLITRNLASMNLLACLDILTSVPDAM